MKTEKLILSILSLCALSGCIGNNDFNKIQEISARAELGDSAAMCELAQACLSGTVIPRNETKAYELYINAALTDGNSDAQCALGFFYMNAIAVKRDYNEALKWLELAERGGCSRAKELRKAIEKFSTTTF